MAGERGEKPCAGPSLRGSCHWKGLLPQPKREGYFFISWGHGGGDQSRDPMEGPC